MEYCRREPSLHRSTTPSLHVLRRMNPKSTWFWAVVAAILFACVLLYERHARELGSGPTKVLPGFSPATITSIQGQPAGQLEIRAERTNGTWRLTKPLAYPAQASAIEALLAALEHLTPATYISPQELKGDPASDRKFGFESWQAALT